MPQQKLLDILSSFDKRFWVRCRKYVSDRYSKDAHERMLYEYIYRYRANLNHEALTRRRVQNKMFSSQSTGAFNKLVSRLCQSIQDCIVIEELSSDQFVFERRMILSKYYQRKGLFKYFRQLSKDIVSQTEQGSEYDLVKRLKLMLVKFELSFSQLPLSEKKDYFNQMVRDLMIYNENMTKLMSIEMISQNRLFDSGLLGEQQHLDNALYQFLDQLQGLVVDRSEESYQYVESHLDQISQSKSNVKLALLTLLYLINHCYYKIKKGDENARYKVISLYEYGLKSNILLSSGPLTETQFLNIIELKAKLQSSVDHIKFIDRWLPHTETIYEKSVRNLALALVHFGKEEYDRANNYLIIDDTKTLTVHLGMMSRWLRICCLLAMNRGKGNYPNFKITLRSHERYFRRKSKKIGVANFEGSLNLLKIIKLMWEEKELEEIKSKVSSFDHLVFRYWIDKELKKMSDF